MSQQPPSKTLPPKACYVMLPLPATLNLANTGQRAASRVLFALCLHSGPDRKPFYPSYATISKFAYISENAIREALDVLVKRGYISIEKVREGRKTTNHYSILDKAFTEEISHRTKKTRVDTSIRICHTCYEEVPANEGISHEYRTWEGQKTRVLRHAPCWSMGASGELVIDSPGIRMRQEDYWSRNGRKVIVQQDPDDQSESL